MRLHEALEGDALELVSGQLLLAKLIPRVIEKLHRYFGRPEHLLESLLDKVNWLQPPKADNFRSNVVNPLLIKSTGGPTSEEAVAKRRCERCQTA